MDTDVIIVRNDTEKTAEFSEISLSYEFGVALVAAMFLSVAIILIMVELNFPI